MASLKDNFVNIAVSMGLMDPPEPAPGPPPPFLEWCIGFTLLVYTFETYLEYRQRRAILKGPSEAMLARKNFSKAHFEQAQAYSLVKWRFSLIKDFATTAESGVLLLYGFLPWLWDVSLVCVEKMQLGRIGLDPSNEVYVSCIFIYLVMLESMLVNLPFSAYFTFVVEERFGFNKQTPKLFIVDTVKQLALTMGLLPPVFALIIPILRQTGPMMAVYLWGALMALSLVMVTIYPVCIAPLFNKFTPLDEGPLRTKIEALASALSFPLRKLYVKDGSARSSHSNAYMYGFFKNKRIVLYDTLISQCKGNDGEVVAVLAHELGHWKLSHTVSLFMSQQLVMLTQFGVFAAVRATPGLFESFGFVSSKPVLVGLILFQYIIAPVSAVIHFLTNMISRRFEFQADAFAVSLGYSEDLQGALLRLEKENKSCPSTDPLYAAYHYSHPPLEERLAAMTGKGLKTE